MLRPVTLVWTAADGPALELAVAELGGSSMRARGTWVRTEPEPHSLSYRLETTPEMVTASLTVSTWGGGWSRFLELRRHYDGRWVADPGGELGGLADALDCDLARCCLTNTMPVLRHRLLEDGQVDLVMAWVSVPDLTIEVSPQRYTHLRRLADGGAVVRFESESFQADITFDASGFVVDYPGLARRAG